MTDEWSGYKIETDGVPMVDSATGRPLILRTFEFAINPLKVKELTEKGITFDKQQLFNTHWPYIKSLIWADGLVANTDIDPRVIVGKKRYRIFILCEPKFRQMLADKPTTLQDVFNKRKK